MGEYTVAAGAHGLATGFGDTASVGIGGITLGGGVGYLVRKFGLTIGHLLAAEVVTANGQILHVDANTHPDLFWAIRGGGGNFGVATKFQFRLHEVGSVVGGMLILPATPDTISKFIPDFVCKLKDSRILVVEYKGGHLYTDAEEKRAIGELWEKRSQGRCLFAMPTNRNFADIQAKIGKPNAS